MSTTWIASTRFEPRSWLLANGEVVDEPPLEQTATGRKMRVQGTTDSFYAKDLDDLLKASVERIATEKGTRVFLPLYGMKDADRILPREPSAQMHLTNPDNGKTTCWWKFKHPSMPYAVTISLTLSPGRYGHQTMTTRAYSPRPFGHFGDYEHGFRYDTVSLVSDLLNGVPDNKRTAWYEYLRDTPLDWAQDTVNRGEKTFPTARLAAAGVLEVVRKMESLGEIEWPNFAAESPEYMSLDLYDSNVNSQFISDLTDFLDAPPTVAKAAEVYQELLATLRTCGYVVDDMVSDFELALGSNTVKFRVTNTDEIDSDVDHYHNVVVNAMTGTMIVECGARTPHGDAAERWEEAKTIAALTGEEDALLAYARAYVDEKAAERTKQILKQRGA